MIEADVGNDKILEECSDMVLKELFHFWPDHEAFEELEAVEDDGVVFGVI